ncbi:MAG: hypothetical protein EOP08_14675, partial [Proteobacteria bacterium]
MLSARLWITIVTAAVANAVSLGVAAWVLDGFTLTLGWWVAAVVLFTVLSVVLRTLAHGGADVGRDAGRGGRGVVVDLAEGHAGGPDDQGGDGPGAPAVDVEARARHDRIGEHECERRDGQSAGDRVD